MILSDHEKLSDALEEALENALERQRSMDGWEGCPVCVLHADRLGADFCSGDLVAPGARDLYLCDSCPLRPPRVERLLGFEPVERPHNMDDWYSCADLRYWIISDDDWKDRIVAFIRDMIVELREKGD